MQALDLATQSGPILVTVTYVLVYYGFIVGFVLRAKIRLGKEYADRGEKFDRYFSQDREMLAADRIQLNMLEHMAPFLVLLWLNALFVSPTRATVVGGIYVASRLLYPFVIGSRLGRGVKAPILLSTVPGYGVIFYFMGALVYAIATA